MPKISEFYGISIYMYDHSPPHFHAMYADEEAVITIDALRLVQGSLPRRARALVSAWASQHRDELRANWGLARLGQPLQAIEPLP
jgi:hypothetical protein